MIIPFEKNNNCFNLINISLGHVNGTLTALTNRQAFVVMCSSWSPSYLSMSLLFTLLVFDNMKINQRLSLQQHVILSWSSFSLVLLLHPIELTVDFSFRIRVGQVKLEGAFDLGVHAVISWCQFSMYDGNILYPVYETKYFVRFALSTRRRIHIIVWCFCAPITKTASYILYMFVHVMINFAVRTI